MLFRKTLPYILDGRNILMLAVACCLSFAFVAQVIAQDEKRIVTIHIDEATRYIPTRVDSVDELLKQADITLREGDIVEPALDTLILQDSFVINVYRARPVAINDNGKRTILTTGYQSPQKIAEVAGITMYPEDKVQLKRVENAFVSGIVGEQVDITRAKLVNLNLYGSNVVVRTQAATVGDFLREKQIDVSSGNQVLPPPETPITDNMSIFVVREGVRISTSEEEIGFKTQTIVDENIPEGQKRIQQKGANGKRSITYELVSQNGREVRGSILQEIIIVQPVNQIEVIGKNTKDFLGDLSSKFAALRQCESGSNYANKNNPRYRGAYQYDYATWNNYGGYYDPADAPPSLQDQKAYETYLRRGWQPWPACSRKLGL